MCSCEIPVLSTPIFRRPRRQGRNSLLRREPPSVRCRTPPLAFWGVTHLRNLLHTHEKCVWSAARVPVMDALPYGGQRSRRRRPLPNPPGPRLRSLVHRQPDWAYRSNRTFCPTVWGWTSGAPLFEERSAGRWHSHCSLLWPCRFCFLRDSAWGQSGLSRWSKRCFSWHLLSLIRVASIAGRSSSEVSPLGL